jgi:organic radical activating enzyme
MTEKMTFARVDLLRATPLKSALLFITDRCPVGCAHCSVDARSDSPMITDWPLFEALLDGLAQREALEIVGISGGEPFVERRGLTLAVEKLRAAGKGVVPYTSGVWARETIPTWIPALLQRVQCVFLSMDAFHQKTVDQAALVRAVRTIACAGPWLVVQAQKDAETLALATAILVEALGPDWKERAEIHPIGMLPYGRAQEFFQLSPRIDASAFRACSGTAAPVVRYDGILTACCNEELIMGKGPERLRLRAATSDEVGRGLDAFHESALLRCIRGVPIGRLPLLPQLEELAHNKYKSKCDLCWKLVQHENTRDTNPMIQVIAMMTEASK